MSNLVSLIESLMRCGLSIEEASAEAKSHLDKERAQQDKERAQQYKERAHNLEMEKINLEMEKIKLEQLKLAESNTTSEALAKLDKKLKFVVKEVVVQHRIRMDNWTESKRTKEEQEAFKNSLIAFYQRQHPSDPNLLRCMVLDDFFPKNFVIASHIWKHCTHGEGLDEFGLREDDLSNPRNGILMCRDIEQAFDTKRLCFLVDRINTNNLVLKLLDPVLMEASTSPLVILGYSPLKFCDIDGYSLRHPINNIPFRRILDYHAKRSYQKAINRGWLVANSSFDDFFDMSIGASVPDLYVYQTLFDDEESDDCTV